MKINTHTYNALIHTWCMSSRRDYAKTNTYVAGTQPPRKYRDTYIMKNREKIISIYIKVMRDDDEMMFKKTDIT